ncbi:MAG: M14 family zinc carboxypeptidase [Calditrichia bacterium]
MNTSLRHIVLLSLLLCPTLLLSDWRPKEMKVKVELQKPEDLAKLTELGITPAHTQLPIVYLHIIPAELKALREIGFTPQILIASLSNHSRNLLKQPALQGYLGYNDMLHRLEELQKQYQHIIRLQTIGKSVLGRKLIAVKISDNPSLSEAEPKLAFDGGYHGDEIITTEVLIRFIEDFCSRYATDKRVRQLINSREIHVLPLVNPDGRETLTRRNANHVDLNRDWGHLWNSAGNSEHPFSQPETRAVLNWINKQNFSIHQSLHAGAQLISYPWSCRPGRVPDAALFDYLASGYATSSGYSTLQLGSGYNELYPVCGTAKDAYYALNGTLGWTMELTQNKTPAYSEVDAIYQQNKPSFLYLLQQVGHGLAATIQDAQTGKPVMARIEIRNDRQNFWPIYSPRGYFHKFLLQGKYELRVSANGYKTAVFPNISVKDTGAVKLNIALSATSGSYAFKTMATRVPQTTSGLLKPPFQALGSPDNRGYSLGRNGWIILDMAAEVRDLPGDDLRIFEAGNSNEGYELSVSINPHGPWKHIGGGRGTSDFDLARHDIARFRYLRIEDDGDGFSGLSNAGFDLDAVESSLLPGNEPYLIAESYTVLDTLNNFNGILEIGETAGIRIKLENLGKQTSAAGKIRVRQASPGITVLTDSSSFPSLSPGASVWCDGFGLRIEPTINLERETIVQLEMRTAKGKAWLHPLNLQINSGGQLELSVSELTFDAVFIDSRQTTQLQLNNSGSDSLKIFRLHTKGKQFSVEPSQLIIPPFQSTLVNVYYQPIAEQQVNDTLQILSNDPRFPRRYLALSGSGIQAPELRLQTDSLHLSLLPNDSASILVGLQNIGAGMLNYSVSMEFEALDGFKLSSSDSPESRRFQWINYQEFEQLEFTRQQKAQKVSLPFQFKFQGKKYRTITVSTNGQLIFSDSTNIDGESDLKISALGSQLRTSGNSKISYWTSKDMCVFEWKEMSFAKSDGVATFRITLSASGKIDFAFRQITQIPQGSAIEIVSTNKENQTLHAFKEREISNYSVYSRPTIEIAVDSGSNTLAAGESIPLKMHLKTLDYHKKNARFNLVIDSNAPNQQRTRIPISLQVSEELHIDEFSGSVPEQVELQQNFPNPFNPQTTISFRLPEPVHARLVVYNTLGQIVNTLIDEPLSTGEFRIPWRAINDVGQVLPSGIYFYELKAGDFSQIRKMILLH